MNNVALKQQPVSEITQITGMVRAMLEAVEKSSNLAQEAFAVANESKTELLDFKTKCKDVLERQNRIDSSQIRSIRRTVEERVKFLVKQVDTDDQNKLKRRYFSWCYRSIHDACLVNTITDIPQKLYDHAMKAAREWVPAKDE